MNRTHLLFDVLMSCVAQDPRRFLDAGEALAAGPSVHRSRYPVLSAAGKMRVLLLFT